jgi:uncharacterized protein YecE (DUF72 family)
MIFVGTAGWALDANAKPLFDEGESHLARYATRLSAVEINSSFYRPHRVATYVRWAASVPDEFRFAVKLPRAITHLARLKNSKALLDAFHGQVTGLGEKLGPVLIQLPPSLGFDLDVAKEFLVAMRTRFAGALVLEPRHASWFGPSAGALMEKFNVTRAHADPEPVSGRGDVRGAFQYYRWHGSPVMYRSNYDEAALAALAAKLKDGDWCIFDNTAEGAAISNALSLQKML